MFLYPPRSLWVGILFSVVHPCICPSVMFCYLNILKSHCWNFTKLCNHILIYKTNTLNKRVRARGQFYYLILFFIILNGFLCRILWLIPPPPCVNGAWFFGLAIQHNDKFWMENELTKFIVSNQKKKVQRV